MQWDDAKLLSHPLKHKSKRMTKLRHQHSEPESKHVVETFPDTSKELSKVIRLVLGES